MDVGSSFVANGESAELGQPGQGALDDPAITAESFVAVDATPGDAILDAPPPQGLATAGIIVSLVGMQLVRSFARSPVALTDRLQAVDQDLEHHGIVDVGGAQGADERDAVPIDQDVAFGAFLAAIRRVGAGVFTPLFAR